MIIQIIHKGLRQFYETGSKRGIQAKQVDKLQRILGNLDVAVCPMIWTCPVKHCTHSKAVEIMIGR